MEATERVARIAVDKGKELTRVLVSVPHKPTAREMAALQTTIVDKVIKDLTGCPCMSGAIELIFRDEFKDSIRVDLGSGRVL